MGAREDYALGELRVHGVEGGGANHVRGRDCELVRGSRSLSTDPGGAALVRIDADTSHGRSLQTAVSQLEIRSSAAVSRSCVFTKGFFSVFVCVGVCVLHGLGSLIG